MRDLPEEVIVISGGSYSYLGDQARFYNLVLVPEAMTRMADRLAGLSYAADVAAETKAVIEHLEAAREMAAKLGEVWTAVEWWDSGDGRGEIDVHEALAKYRGDNSSEGSQS
ncbi:MULTISPECIES: hypothetical protein [unclassified Nonomuraea]|uniref:hypothetical protein n=1 Tax=unclassified Nonomuraea TaxID=2593643 RepID=UPI0033C34C67